MDAVSQGWSWYNAVQLQSMHAESCSPEYSRNKQHRVVFLLRNPTACPPGGSAPKELCLCFLPGPQLLVLLSAGFPFSHTQLAKPSPSSCVCNELWVALRPHTLCHVAKCLGW